MGIPIDDTPLLPTDDESVDAVPAPVERPHDSETPVRDAIEQASEVEPGWRVGRLSQDPEAPEADALDQALEVPGTDPTED